MRHISAEPPPFFHRGPSPARAARVLRPAVDRADVRRHALPLPRRHPAGRGGRAVSAAARRAAARRSAVVGRRLFRVEARRWTTRTRHSSANSSRARSSRQESSRLARREREPARAARHPEALSGRGDRRRGALHRARSVHAEGVRQPRQRRRHSRRRSGDRRAGRRRPGHARVSEHGRGDARHRQGPRGAGARGAQRRAQRVLRRRRGTARPSCASWRRPPTSSPATGCPRRASTAPIRPGLAVAQVDTVDRETGQVFAQDHRASSRWPAPTAARICSCWGRVRRSRRGRRSRPTATPRRKGPRQGPWGYGRTLR